MYTQGKFVKVYNNTVRREAVQSLIYFTKYFGLPETLTPDGAGEFNFSNT